MRLVEDRKRSVTYTTRPVSSREVEDIFSLIVDAANILDSNSRRLGFNNKLKLLLHTASNNFMKAWSDYTDLVDNGQLVMAESDDMKNLDL